MTISYRVRKQIVDYFAQRKSSQEIASMLNVSLDQIQDWRRRYKHGHEDWVFSDHQKFSIQERKEILVDFFSQQKYGIKAYAARHNLSYNTFKGWVKKVRKYGGSIDFAFISHRPKIKNLCLEHSLVALLIEQIRKGAMSTSAAATAAGVCIRTVQRWLRKYSFDSEFRRTIDSSLIKTGMRTMENNKDLHRLCKQNAVRRWVKRELQQQKLSKTEIVKRIDELRAEGVTALEACDLFQIHRSTYYRIKKRLESITPNSLVDAIRTFQVQHRFSYGAKRMAVEMSRQFNVAINHKRVARLMRAYGLNARIRREKKSFPRGRNSCLVDDRPTTNLLKRNFKAKVPRTKFVSDMTFFHTREGWLILGTIKDLCTKEIVAWDFDTGATVELALKTLKQIRFYGGSILHSDQGGTYTSPAYRDEAEKLGITLSYSRKGNCYDNASMENFYGHLKSETIYQMPFHQRYGSTRKELIAIINDYIQWYNEERIQEGLGYLSPTNFFKKMNLETVAN